MSGEISPGGNPVCIICKRWYGPGEKHVCTLEDRIAARVKFYEAEFLSDSSPITRGRADEAQAILNIIREQQMVRSEVDSFLSENLCNPKTGVHAVPHKGCIL